MENKIQFKHFLGNLNTWESKVSSNKWVNSIVFGKIWDSSVWIYKIYAGDISVNNINVKYVYDIPSKEQITNIENTLNEVSTNVTNIFKILDASIKIHERCLTWVIES